MVAKRKVPMDLEREAQFDRAFEQLTQLVDLQQADQLHPVCRLHTTFIHNVF